MARKGRVFNNLRRPKLLRKEIPLAEAGVGAGLVLAIAGMAAWVALQRERYDPAERDVSMEALEQGAVADTLYKAPLRRWRDPEQEAAGAPPAAVDTAPFPAAVLDGGWTASRPERFDPDNLYEKINGQAEQYLKFGFQRLDVLALRQSSGPLTFDLYLYDQGSLANALGLYEEQRGAREVRSQGAVHATPNALGAIAALGRYLVHIIGSAEGAPTQEKTAQLLSALAPLAGEEPLPLPFEALHERLGLPLAQVGYQPVNVFQFGFAQRFWFGRLSPGADARLFVHEAGSEPAAAALFERVVAEQAEEYEALERGAASARLRHRFLGTVFAIELEGALVYGVEGAADEEAARAALGRLRDALRAGGGEGER